MEVKNASKTLRLPRLAGDGMVLQRDASLPIWGWAAPGQTITVWFLEQTHVCTAGTDGKWQVTLPAMDAGGPYEMTITADCTVTLRNILVGDVWVCAGQSNMQLTLDRVKDRYPADVADCVQPWLRLFTVPQRHDFISENEDLASGEWITPSPDTILQFTAVGYFFAQELHRRYGVPIGLLAAAIGGAPVEAWLSEAALLAFPDALERVKPFKQEGYLEAVIENDEKNAADWYDALERADLGIQAESTPWYDDGLDTSEWRTMPVPSYWADAGIGPINGVVWFRKEIALPASMSGLPGRLELGRIVDSDTVYINGVEVGSVGYQYPPRKYDIPAGLLKAGTNSITVRVVSTWGKGGYVSGKPYRLTAGGQSMDLEGLWRYKIGAVSEPAPPQTHLPSLPLSLYNGMITPLFKYSIKGVIWYQGESNLSSPTQYHALFKTLIKTWRRSWHQGDFPFLFVQLPNYDETLYQEFGSPWALIRAAQLQTLEVPNTAMAVAIDLGEWNDLHPLDKKNVAYRLSLGARHLAYGENDLSFSGPIIRSVSDDNGRLVLAFDHVGGGLCVKGSGQLGGFEIAGPDGLFTEAQAKIEGQQIVVWRDGITDITAVRYAWADNPEGATLYNTEGLPASPFRVYST